jgi:hypothetical protein
MAKYQITYWRNIPSMVTAQEGRRNRARVELSQRFQEAIDEAAMRSGLAGTDAYLSEWRKDEWRERDGDPQEVADAIAAELETEYDEARVKELVNGKGQ